MFILEDGASISNAILSKAQAEGIHCRGACTITNVWWEDVCEDAATFKQAAGKSSTVNGGGARGAADKIFQFNGRGTVTIKNFYAEDYGKVIRSCGDCTGNGGPRNVVIDNVVAKDGGVLCGVNSNYGGESSPHPFFNTLMTCGMPWETHPSRKSFKTDGRTDTCRISNSCQSNNKTCDRYEGVVKGNGSSEKIGSGPDGTSCSVSGFASSC